MKPFVIEFLGTQGSGKTTLLPEVVEFFKEQGIHAYTTTEAARPFARRTWLGKLVGAIAPAFVREQLLWLIYYNLGGLSRLTFNSKNRELVRFVHRTQHARPASAGVRERRILFWFSHLTGCYTFLKKHARENEALVFDDGFAHRAVHLNGSPVEEPKKEDVVEYLSHIPVPSLLIVPRVSLEMCLERVQNRGVWDHFRGRTQDELRHYLANSEYIVNIAVEELHKRGCLIVEVDNSHFDRQRAIDDLREKLKGVRLSSPLS